VKELILNKKDLPEFFDLLSNAYTVYGREFSAGIPLYREVKSVEEVMPGLSTPGNSPKSPKNIFFPEAETLYRYEEKGDDVELSVPKEDFNRSVILGIRPCDARAFLVLDEVFLGDPIDPAYMRRRANTTLIGLACAHSSPTCFCLSVGGGPQSTEGLDILLTDLGERFFVEVLTEKGEKLVENVDIFGTPEAGDKDKKEELKKKAEEGMREFDVEAAMKALEGAFGDAFWDEATKKCLGCGSCTYICPTCHCFNISDSRGKRTRTWDSCQFPIYSLHTSSHNPRPDKKSRMRNRLYHKFKYIPDSMEGRIGCVGCGRCIMLCGVSLDLIEVLEGLVEARKKEGEVKE
jgi:ferredoxin